MKTEEKSINRYKQCKNEQEKQINMQTDKNENLVTETAINILKTF